MTGYHKTLDDHCATLHGLVRLQLHAVHRWCAAHPDEPLAAVMAQRVDIWRKTDLNPGGLVEPLADPDGIWSGLVEQIAELQRRLPGEAQRDAFEEQAHAMLRERIDRRAAIDLQHEIDGLHLREYGGSSLRFHDCAPQEPGTVFIHIANAVAPRSIFAEAGYLEGCLRRLLDQAEQRCRALRVRSATWLNAHPAWLALFPAEWSANLGPADHDLHWHYGFWGQFLNARGCLNQRLAGLFRSSGLMPYPPRTAWCGIAALRAHLATRP